MEGATSREVKGNRATRESDPREREKRDPRKEAAQ